MRLAFIIPVSNRSNTIKGLIEKIESLKIEKDIIVVDDASTDGTADILNRLHKEKRVDVVFHVSKRGCDFCISTAIKYVKSDVFFVYDEGTVLDEQLLGKFVEIFSNNADVDLVYGVYRDGLGFRKLATGLSNLFLGVNTHCVCDEYIFFRTNRVKEFTLKSNSKKELFNSMLGKKYKFMEIELEKNQFNDKYLKMSFKEFFRTVFVALKCKLNRF